MHDEVVQSLVSINVELAALSAGTSLGLRNLKTKILRAQRLVENSVNAVHRFARELRPAMLDDLGLIPALHAYSKNLAEGSEDSQGRALWALGECVGQGRDRGRSLLAEQVFRTALPAVKDLSHPRTRAFTLLGIDAFLRRHPDDHGAAELRTALTRKLAQRFAEHTRDDWHWLADNATYDNARLPQALILSGRAMHEPELEEMGLKALQWLVRIQTSEHGSFQPIGSNGFMHRNGTRAGSAAL